MQQTSPGEVAKKTKDVLGKYINTSIHNTNELTDGSGLQ